MGENEALTVILTAIGSGATCVTGWILWQKHRRESSTHRVNELVEQVVGDARDAHRERHRQLLGVVEKVTRDLGLYKDGLDAWLVYRSMNHLRFTVPFKARGEVRTKALRTLREHSDIREVDPTYGGRLRVSLSSSYEGPDPHPAVEEIYQNAIAARVFAELQAENPSTHREPGEVASWVLKEAKQAYASLRREIGRTLTTLCVVTGRTSDTQHISIWTTEILRQRSVSVPLPDEEYRESIVEPVEAMLASTPGVRSIDRDGAGFRVELEVDDEGRPVGGPLPAR